MAGILGVLSWLLGIVVGLMEVGTAVEVVEVDIAA